MFLYIQTEYNNILSFLYLLKYLTVQHVEKIKNYIILLLFTNNYSIVIFIQNLLIILYNIKFILKCSKHNLE